MPSSPPRERRDEVVEICRRHGGRLCEDQIYYDEHGNAHVLIELPSGEAEQQALRDELRAHEWLGLVHADERAGGTEPPSSGRR